MQEYYRLDDGVSEAEANLIFNNVAWKVIKAEANLIFNNVGEIYFPFVRRCWSFWFFTLTCKGNFFMHAGVEMVDEAHLGSQDLSDQGATPSGWVDWLVKDQEAWDWLCDYWASDEFRVVLEQNRMNRQSKPLVHHYSTDGHVRKT
jgi:hypothetical protein